MDSPPTGRHNRLMRFIVFEGLDGSGKSTLMKQLEDELARRGRAFVRTREPGGTPLGDEIRHLILRKDGDAPSPRTELLLYEASRSQHVDKVIRPALAKKSWVLSDRFSASSIAFQAGGRSIGEDKVVMLNEFATDGLAPDLTILVDLTVEESRKRRQKRTDQGGDAEDRIEAEADAFHERVRQSFLAQARGSATWLVLNGGDTPETLTKKMLAHIEGLGWLA